MITHTQLYHLSMASALTQHKNGHKLKMKVLPTYCTLNWTMVNRSIVPHDIV